MHGIYPVDEVRAAENALMATLPDGALMQRASTALALCCASVLRSRRGRVYGAQVVLLVGSGNNGGDALFAGAQLALRGARVTALLAAPDRVHAEGRAALVAAGGRVAGADRTLVRDADLVVDGLLGIGGRGGLRAAAAELASAAADRFVVAVDLPSAVDADTGAAGFAAVRADVTVTFGCLKPGVVVGAGAELAGLVRLADIGLAPLLPAARTMLLEAKDVQALLPTPTPRDDKYSRSVVGVIAGSPQYPGAGVLATGAALCGGVGMVRYLGRAPEQISARFPEVVVHAAARPQDVRVQAWIVGPGLGIDEVAAALVADVLATDVPVLLDADAVTVVGRSPELVRNRTAPTVLTPHDGEFARIAGGPGPDRLAAVRRAAADLGATVLLKGNVTLVAEPDGPVYANPTGTPWLATAGSGDVLSGLIGSLLAAGVPTGLAAAAGSYLHGVAGQLAAATGPPSAVDILDSLRAAIHSVTTG